MSRHRLVPREPSIEEVTVGFDWPTQEFFVQVFEYPAEDGEERLLFSQEFRPVAASNKTPDTHVWGCIGAASKFAHIPPNLYAELQRDRGDPELCNRTVRWQYTATWNNH